MVGESGLARRRGALSVQGAGDGAEVAPTADAEALGRLRRLNAIASGAFVIGGALFALCAAVAQFGSGDPVESASIYFAGGPLPTADWRWWVYESMRLDWLSTFVLFVGTLVFAVNLLDSFLQGFTVQEINRLMWTPDVIRCVLFLVSGHLAFVEI